MGRTTHLLFVRVWSLIKASYFFTKEISKNKSQTTQQMANCLLSQVRCLNNDIGTVGFYTHYWCECMCVLIPIDLDNHYFSQVGHTSQQPWKPDCLLFYKYHTMGLKKPMLLWIAELNLHTYNNSFIFQ